MRSHSACPQVIKKMGFYSSKRSELRPMPCGGWACPVCGKAKAWRLGLEASEAEPERWVMLSRAGTSPDECYKGLKTLSRALRRRGYRWEYVAVPERDPSGSGWWHLHILQKGDYIPQRELSYLAERSGMGSYVWIEAVKGGPRAVANYMVKYMVKDERYRPPASRRYKSSRGFWGPGGYKAFKERYKGARESEWRPRYMPSGGFISENGQVFSLPGDQGGDRVQRLEPLPVRSWASYVRGPALDSLKEMSGWDSTTSG